MKELKSKKWFFPLTVVFLLCLIALGIQMTYGAYIRRSYVKSVIATNETEKLFGSNLLYGVKNQPSDPEADNWLSVYPFTVENAEVESITIPLKIYNYLAEDKDRVNQLDVSYKICIKIAGNPTETNGQLTGYSIAGHSISNKDTVYYLGSFGLTENKENAKIQTLAGRLPNMNQYDIVIPGKDLGKVSIAVKAIREKNTNNSYGTDLLYLASRIVPSLASTVQSATVSGKFEYSLGEQPKDYAAYNYTVELSGAPTAVELTWDNNLLEIDPFFQEKFGVEPGSGSVTFNMEPGITKIQFYRKGDVQDVSWSNLGVNVSSH